MMFAVIKTGGKQYRVAAEDMLRVERLRAEPGQVVEFAEVLAVGGDAPSIGTPTVPGATVAGELIEHGRGAKVIAFKKRRRKNSRRKRGHRQEYSLVRITEILTDGRRPSPTPPPRPSRARWTNEVAAEYDFEDAEEDVDEDVDEGAEVHGEDTPDSSTATQTQAPSSAASATEAAPAAEGGGFAEKPSAQKPSAEKPSPDTGGTQGV